MIVLFVLLFYFGYIEVSSSHSSSVPYIKGIFLSLYSVDYDDTAQQWEQEFHAMKNVGIEFVSVRAALQGTSNETEGGICGLGKYKAYYPTNLTPSICYQNDMKSSATFLNLLTAAQKYEIKVHVTPAMPHSPYAWPHTPKEEYYNSLKELELAAFMDVWNTFPSYHDTIVGVYTALEEWNGVSWMNDENAVPMANQYLEPLTQSVQNLTGIESIQVWASPYYVGNFSLHPTGQNATDYAEFWNHTFQRAPSLGWIALQDSIGWQGNNNEEVKEVLIELNEKIGKTRLWSNIELFEGSPPPCIYPKKCGREPASMERIKGQLSNEDPYVQGHIAWEWISCLSPYTNSNTSKLYHDYSQYLIKDA